MRQSRKAEKEEKSEKLKIKKAIEKGNLEGAKIYAQVTCDRITASHCVSWGIDRATLTLAWCTAD